MRIKSAKLFGIVILVTFISLLTFGCGKQGSRFANHAPMINITSYEGYDPASAPVVDSMDITLFQQRIFWHAEDSDGVIAGFAFRILDANGNPMSTPGNKFIDSTGEFTPDNVNARYPGAGWVLHYKPGADQSIPLDSLDAKKTIWTNQKYALVNFIAATAAGVADTTISSFEVICYDNRGEVCQTSAVRKFRSYSKQPTCMLTTTKGNPNGDQVGTGIRLSFSLSDGDPFIQATAWYYEFKVQKCNATDSTVISTMPATGWYSTINEDKINQYLLTRQTTPPLSSDYDASDNKVTFTKVVGRVVDLAGIVSDPTDISFAVKEGFHPETLIYHKRVFALGNNHYIDYNDDSTPEVLPYTIVNNEQRFATRLFLDKDSLYTAVKSSNLKVWLRWGWHGEYGRTNSNGTYTVTDDPYDKKIDLLLDANNRNYYSEVTHFDIRLDGQPYNYPPLGDSFVTDNDGKRWLRVPINSALGQTIVLTSLSTGIHTFEVRAVDLQGEPDTTPVLYQFKIVDPVPKAQKTGVLVIDDDLNNTPFAPEATVDGIYEAMFSDQTETIAQLDRSQLLYTDVNLRKIALSDIQQYKLIIWHSDNTTVSSNLAMEHDALSLYLKQGGNMIISGGTNISGAVQATILGRKNFFDRYFGLAYVNNVAQSITNNFVNLMYFNKAKSQITGFGDIGLAFDMDINNPAPAPYVDGGETILADPNEASFVPLVNTRKGIGTLTYFNTVSYNANAIFKYGPKPVHAGAPANMYLPNQADFDALNNKTIGVRKITADNSCYILGFPLSYMKAADAKAFINSVMSNIN